MQSVPISTTVVCSNLAYSEVYSIQHYVIKFVSNLRQVSGFLQVLQFPTPIKLTATIIEILLKVVLNTINILNLSLIVQTLWHRFTVLYLTVFIPIENCNNRQCYSLFLIYKAFRICHIYIQCQKDKSLQCPPCNHGHNDPMRGG